MAWCTTTPDPYYKRTACRVYVAAIDGVAGTAGADALATRENVANAWLSMHMPGRKRLNLVHPQRRPRTSRLVRCFINANQAVTQFKHVVPSTQGIDFIISDIQADYSPQRDNDELRILSSVFDIISNN